MAIEIIEREAKTILTAQKGGFLASAPYPFTHSLSAYVGCGFGQTTCGLYCYAPFMPNWLYHYNDKEWGTLVGTKANAPAVLAETLAKLKPARRQALRIFMSPTTDPYQPLEREHRLTRRLLDVFARYDDLDLLVIQTRGPLAERDFDLMVQIPYAWLSVTIETDDEPHLKQLRGGPALHRRFALIERAAQAGIHTQIAVSPCMPYTPDFVARLAQSGARRLIIDNCVEGDGTGGKRTAQSGYAVANPAWNDVAISRQLYEQLEGMNVTVGWSAAGFCGIPPRRQQQGFLV